MIIVSVEQAYKDARKLHSQLSQQQLNTAMSRSLNETILQARTEARKMVKTIYNIPQKNLGGINVNKASGKTLTAWLYASAIPIPMDAFSPVFKFGNSSITVSRKGQQKVKSLKKKVIGAGVSIEVLKGQKETVPFAFMIAGAKPRVFARGEYRSGTSYGFVRRNKRANAKGSDTPIKPLLSVTVHAAVVNETSIKSIEQKADAVFASILDRNINFLLSKNTSNA